jgi:hypothetical protein
VNLLYKSGLHSEYIDKTKSRRVIMTNDSFESICKGFGHSKARPEIIKYLAEIRKAIENPTWVRKSAHHDKRFCYYAAYVGDFAHKNQHMKVVVHETWYSGLEIVTAYFTPDLNPKEKIIWPIN